MTKRNWRGFPEGQGYFDELPMLQRKMIKEMVKDAFEREVTAEIYTDRDAEEIECRGRDGFIPYSHNRGGVDVSGFCDLGGMWGSGYMPTNDKARERIEKLIEQAHKDASETFFERHKALFEKYNLTIEDANYHRIEEIENSPNPEFDGLANEFSELEMESLSGDYSSVMYQYRIMYHGKDERGVHSMTVFASISATDAPYHRSSDSCGEVLITWKRGRALKAKLAKALRDAAKEGF
jgi:hypothetical protein